MYLKIFHKKLSTARCCETSSFFFAKLRRASLVLRQTTRLLVNKTTSGASQGYANASPDYETTSQQDNEWGALSLR